MRIDSRLHESYKSASTLELFNAASGRLSARLKTNGGFLLLHSAIDPESEADHFDTVEFWGAVIVFLGTGLGYHVAKLLNTIPTSAIILLVDFHEQLVDYCKSNVFNHLPNIIITVSSETPDCISVIRQASIGTTSVQVIKHPASYHAKKPFYDSVSSAFYNSQHRAKKPSGALLMQGNFFLEEELLRALADHDGSVNRFCYPNYPDCTRYESALGKTLQKERPEYILSINMKGFDHNGILADYSKQLGIPVVVWFVDDPHPILLPYRSSIRDTMIALSWERAYIPWLKQEGFLNTGYLPLASDPTLFAPKKNREIKTAVGFVGSAMGNNFLQEIRRSFMWNKDLDPIVGIAAHELCKNRTASVWRLIQKACTERAYTLPFSDERNITWLCSYTIHTASMLLRKETIQAALQSGLETFGDPDGWQALFGTAITTHDNIDYRSGLAACYRSIGINLNTTSCQMPTAVNQRVFDVPLCGGFVLNDDQSDLYELFDKDEIAVYKSNEELVDRIDYYRSHPGDAEKIAFAARAKVLSHHTYKKRVAAIRELITAACSS